MSRNLSIQVWLLFGSILANFIAQIFYYLHLYYTPQHPFPELRSFLLLGSVFVLFIASYVLFLRRKRLGYFLLSLYLALEFIFYLWNLLGGVIHGLGWFFHLSEPDPILWVVFAIGYLNLFTSGYFLGLLLTKQVELTGER